MGRLVFIPLVLKVIQGPLYDFENTDEIFIFKIHFFISPLFCLIPLKKVLYIQELTRALSTKIMNTEQNTCSVYLNTNFAIPYSNDKGTNAFSKNY